MKLAEALQERSDLNRRIEQLKSRLMNNALMQEGEAPAEDPAALREELDSALSRLTCLMARINLTNACTQVNGKTLTQLIAEKDTLTLSLSIYRDVVYTASQNTHRARNTEIRILPAVPVKQWQQEIDDMAKRLRQLDNLLQENNWKTELLP